MQVSSSFLNVLSLKEDEIFMQLYHFPNADSLVILRMNFTCPSAS